MAIVYEATQLSSTDRNGRAQDPRLRPEAGRRLRRAVPSRGTGPGTARPPSHRHGVRSWRERRGAVHCDAQLVRRQPLKQLILGRELDGQATSSIRVRDRRCARLRARRRAHPSRRQATEHPHRERSLAQDRIPGRLRRDKDRRWSQSHAHRTDFGHTRLHLSGADPGRGGDSSERHLLGSRRRPTGARLERCRFRATRTLRFLDAHLNEPPASVSNVGLPTSLDAIFRRALSKEPSHRHAAASEFARELAAIAPSLERAMVSSSRAGAPPGRSGATIYDPVGEPAAPPETQSDRISRRLIAIAAARRDCRCGRRTPPRAREREVPSTRSATSQRVTA